MVKSNGKAIKAGIGYTIGNVLIKGIGFMTVPIFSRLMSTEEFGIFNVFLSYESILFVLIGVAIHSSIRSANLEFRGKINEYTSSVSLIYILNLLVFCGIGMLFRKPISTILGLDSSIIILLIFYSFGSAMLTLYNNRIALDYEYKKYLVLALWNSLSNVLCSLILIFTVFKEQKEYARIVGSTATLVAMAIYILINLYKLHRPRIEKKYWKFALKYSLPIVPHGISQTILGTFDKVMINRMVGNAEAGIYSLANNIQLILTVVIDSAMNSLNTWYYEKFDRNEKHTIVNRSMQIGALFLMFSIVLIALTPELVMILGGQKYDLAKYTAMPMIMAAFLIMLYNLFVIVEYYYKKTNYIMIMASLAALINIVMNYIFISIFGFIAAAYTTLFSYFVYLALHIYISHRLLGYYVIPIKRVVSYILYLCIAATMDLLFIDHIIIRWSISLILVLPLVYYLVRENNKAIKK